MIIGDRVKVPPTRYIQKSFHVPFNINIIMSHMCQYITNIVERTFANTKL